MKKDTKGWLIVLGLLTGVSFLLFRRQVFMLFSPEKAAGLTTVPGATTTPATGTAQTPRTIFNETLILKRGMKGPEVRELQRMLKSDGFGQYLGNYGPAGDGVDGDFGAKTEDALRRAKGVTQISLNGYKIRTANNPLAPALSGAGTGQGSGMIFLP